MMCATNDVTYTQWTKVCSSPLKQDMHNALFFIIELRDGTLYLYHISAFELLILLVSHMCRTHAHKK